MSTAPLAVPAPYAKWTAYVGAPWLAAVLIATTSLLLVLNVTTPRVATAQAAHAIDARIARVLARLPAPPSHLVRVNGHRYRVPTPEEEVLIAEGEAMRGVVLAGPPVKRWGSGSNSNSGGGGVVGMEVASGVAAGMGVSASAQVSPASTAVGSFESPRDPAATSSSTAFLYAASWASKGRSPAGECTRCNH